MEAKAWPKLNPNPSPRKATERKIETKMNMKTKKYINRNKTPWKIYKRRFLKIKKKRKNRRK